MRKKFFGLTLGAMLLAISFPAQAQQSSKMPRIGYLVSRSGPGPNDRGFQQGLSELGYLEGQNIVVERRWAGGNPDRLPELAGDLVHLNVDVIFAGGAAVGAVKKATGTIPIVFIGEGDPVASGLVASLARPGGNITGLAILADELAGKRLELLKEAIPRISRVAVLRHSTSDLSHLRTTEAAAQSFGLQVQILEVRYVNDFDSAFGAAKKGRAEALIELASSFLATHRKVLVDLAGKSRLPAMWEHSGFVNDGGLMSYGPSLPELYRRAATYVDKILKGSKPAALPVEQPTKFELMIDLKAAKQIGVTIPPNVLARADRVIR
ncbi:MAG TPA: ABC transporter substrate-binding protein [Candidatus Binatia bacterium]|nr:ABC transporter substrate-binding protein [Candidatus Binatia bacterium]